MFNKKDTLSRETYQYRTEIELIDSKLTNIKSARDDEILKELPAIQRAARLLRKGEVVAFPTETVYGLGANAANAEAVKKIFQAKGRPQDNPLIVHIATFDQLNQIVKGYLNKTSCSLIETFWPGPLTIIAEKSSRLPSETTAGLDSVAIRMPSHPVARAIIKAADLPIAAPSANISGTPSPTTAKHVFNDLQGRIPLIIDGGPARIGIESTVVDTRGELPVILRPGGISQEDIEKVLGYKINTAVQVGLEDTPPLSPGMKYRHYSPATPLIMVYSLKELLKKIKEYRDYKIGLVVTTETREELHDLPEEIQVISMGSVRHPSEIASRIFGILRQLDKPEVDYIIVEAIPEKGLGLAVMNRLNKASLKE